jgi:hypothetical protein
MILRKVGFEIGQCGEKKKPKCPTNDLRGEIFADLSNVW